MARIKDEMVETSFYFKLECSSVLVHIIRSRINGGIDPNCKMAFRGDTPLRHFGCYELIPLRPREDNQEMIYGLKLRSIILLFAHTAI